MITVRDYSPSDKEFLKSTKVGLQAYLVGIDPIKRLRIEPGYGEHFTDQLIKDIESDNGKILIVEDSGIPFGTVSGVIKLQSQNNLLEIVPTKLGIILNLFVEEAYRGKGHGKRLIAEIESYFIENGCDTSWLDVVAFNMHAHDLYEKLGYSDREIGMLKKLS
jgi:ribosomal protein S18 acetylase RimI-like enzyme